MSIIVAGYFDSEDDATRAMDTLLKDPKFSEAESEVISGFARGTEIAGTVPVVPAVPNLSQGLGAGNVMGPPVLSSGARRMLDELDEEEANFFVNAFRDGTGVLALVRVVEDLADDARQIFGQNGARTYQERD